MSEMTMNSERSLSFKIGWAVLIFVTASNVVGHIGLLLFDSWETIFVAWATLNLLAAVIVAIPFRRGERWAWYAVWAVVIPYATIIFFNSEIGPIYLGEAALLVAGQLLTSRAFWTDQKS